MSETPKLVKRLEGLLEEASMPELVAALIRLSRDYSEHLRREKNSEFQGWDVWEAALSQTLRQVEGQDEYEDLLKEFRQ